MRRIGLTIILSWGLMIALVVVDGYIVWEFLQGPNLLGKPLHWVVLWVFAFAVLILLRKEETMLRRATPTHRWVGRITGAACVFALAMPVVDAIAPVVVHFGTTKLASAHTPTGSVNSPVKAEGKDCKAGKADATGRCLQSAKDRGITTEAAQAREPDVAQIQKDVEERINRWGTLFAWLLAAVTLALSLVTSWVMQVAREGRDAVKEVEERLGLELKQRNFAFDLARQTLSMDLQFTHDELDDHRCFVERQRLHYWQSVVRTVERLRRGTLPASTALSKLQSVRMAISADASKSLDPIYLNFVSGDLSTYLSESLTLLLSSPITHLSVGQACADELDKLWAVARDAGNRNK
mgnify:CR=1 FL=1